jgi:hypothetical protein
MTHDVTPPQDKAVVGQRSEVMDNITGIADPIESPTPGGKFPEELG